MWGSSVTTLLYFAPVAWDSYPQRPHSFVEHFLKRGGGRVVWVDPYPTRLPSFRDLRALTGRVRIDRERPANLTVIAVRALPLEPLAAGRWLNRTLLWSASIRRLSRTLTDAVAIGIGRPSSLALAALDACRPARSFYDAMDDVPEFYRGASKTSVRDHERRIAATVDVVVTSSAALWTKFESRGAGRIMVRNAFEMSALPPLPTTRNGRRVFGYVGCVGEWFDWTITVQLARNVPDAEVRIVGPCVSKPPRGLPPNVTLYPACPLPQAIDHLRQFSVAIIPFKRTPLTDAIDPIKYYASRGMGLPVLTTTFGEMRRRGIEDGTFFMDQSAGVSEARSALEARFDAGAIERFRTAHAWERRFAETELFARVLP